MEDTLVAGLVDVGGPAAIAVLEILVTGERPRRACRVSVAWPSEPMTF
ncbi:MULTISPECIES: hypothetical protein [unclassified Mycolicibacterium]|nr:MULTISPECIES: hypothetical protein [unclassified Mycolicibacterium]